MKVFISWSGKTGEAVGSALRDWLPSVLQRVKPYYSPKDIEKGSRWESEIARELEGSAFGIVCVTKETLSSMWVHFEAGALSKQLDRARVCPLVFGLNFADVDGPLTKFQMTSFGRDEMRKLCGAINGACGDDKLNETVLDSVFDKWWPDLESSVKKALDASVAMPAENLRSQEEKSDEMLGLLRSIDQRIGRIESRARSEKLIQSVLGDLQSKTIAKQIVRDMAKTSTANLNRGLLDVLTEASDSVSDEPQDQSEGKDVITRRGNK